MGVFFNKKEIEDFFLINDRKLSLIRKKEFHSFFLIKAI